MTHIIEYDIDITQLYQQGLKGVLSDYKEELKALTDILMFSEENWKGISAIACHDGIIRRTEAIVNQMVIMIELQEAYESYFESMQVTDNQSF